MENQVYVDFESGRVINDIAIDPTYYYAYQAFAGELPLPPMANVEPTLDAYMAFCKAAIKTSPLTGNCYRFRSAEARDAFLAKPAKDEVGAIQDFAQTQLDWASGTPPLKEPMWVRFAASSEDLSVKCAHSDIIDGYLGWVEVEEGVEVACEEGGGDIMDDLAVRGTFQGAPSA